MLDASALLALLQEEPGADDVEDMLERAAMSAVNLSEVLQKAAQHSVPTEGLEHDLGALGLSFIGFDTSAARRASEIWERSPRAVLSLGDRACLALASRLGAVAVTADRRWASLRLTDVRVRVIR